MRSKTVGSSKIAISKEIFGIEYYFENGLDDLLTGMSQKMAEQKSTRKRIEDIMTAANLISKPRVFNGSHAT